MTLCNICNRQSAAARPTAWQFTRSPLPDSVGCSRPAGPLWWLASRGVFRLSGGGFWTRVAVAGSLLHGSLWDALFVLWRPLFAAGVGLRFLWGLWLPWIKEMYLLLLIRSSNQHFWGRDGISNHSSHIFILKGGSWMKVAVFSGAAGRAKLLVQNLIKELLHCCLLLK